MFGEDGYGEGGFDVSGFGHNETPTAGGKKELRRTDRLVPVTVRQVLESSDTGLKLGSTEIDVQMIKLVGIIKKISKSSIKVIYTLEDNTGSIEGVHWLDAESDDTFVTPVVENIYSVMIGSVRNTTAQHNQRHVMVFHIAPVTDLNEITWHTLQIIHIPLKSEEFLQQTPVTPIKQEMASINGSMTSMGGGGSDYAAGFNLTIHQQRVLKAVAQHSHLEEGGSIDAIMSALTVKMPLKQVEEILDFLSCEGHVYSTIDSKHFKSTDV